MNLNKLPKAKSYKKSSKRVGRGYGSGKAKTSGRGQKGQKARGGLSITHPHYEGGQRSLIKRLPFRRGKGNPKVSKKPLVINLKYLVNLPAKTIVDNESLIKFGILAKSEKDTFVKILGDGQIKIPLEIKLPISKSAAKLIEKAGGKVLGG